MVVPFIELIIGQLLVAFINQASSRFPFLKILAEKSVCVFIAHNIFSPTCPCTQMSTYMGVKHVLTEIGV